jgi:hypothetical protein
MVTTGNVSFFAASDTTDAMFIFGQFNLIAFAISCNYYALQVDIRLRFIISLHALIIR